VYHYHCDPLGTPRRLTDNSGQVVWEADYTAFGQARLCVEEISNPLRFPGQYCDAETGLHYNRFRYYSADLGRYLSQDPLGFLAGCNFFAYVDNDPINGSDPLGLFWSTVGGIVVGVAVTVAVTAATIALAPAVAATALGALAIGVTADILGGLAFVAVESALDEGIKNGWDRKCMWQAVVKGVSDLTPSDLLLMAVTGPLLKIAGKIISPIGRRLFPEIANASKRVAQKVYKLWKGKGLNAEEEANYQNYLKRKQSEGKPARNREDWAAASQRMKSGPTQRGIDFNKARKPAYVSNEVTLENGKKLDSYNPPAGNQPGEIVSRKAVDFDSKSESDLRGYLNELETKYPPGSKINKTTAERLDLPERIEGKQYLEVPDTNKNSINAARFEEIAAERGITIRYAPE